MAANWGEKTPEERSADALESIQLKQTLDVITKVRMARFNQLSPEQQKKELRDEIDSFNFMVFLIRAGVIIFVLVCLYGAITGAFSAK